MARHSRVNVGIVKRGESSFSRRIRFRRTRFREKISIN
jgi:hypothetical protein